MQEPLSIPDGMKLMAHWCGGMWPVIAKGYRTLSFHGGIIYPKDELIIQCQSCDRPDAERFKVRLGVMGWQNVTVEHA